MSNLNDYRLRLGRNRIINGAMKIDQRANGVVTNNVAGYSLDRWYTARPVLAAGMKAQRTTTVPAISGTTGFQYSLMFGRVAGDVGVTFCSAYYTMESVDSIDLAGKNVTVSFWAKLGVNFSGVSVTFNLITGTGTDQAPGSFTGATNIVSALPVITTGWQKYTYTAAVGSTATQIGLLFQYSPIGTAGADDAVYITGVQLEQGRTATDFENILAADELARCRRYLPSVTATSGVANAIAMGQCTGTAAANVFFTYPVRPRAAPTGITLSSAGHFTLSGPTGTGVALTGLTFTNSSERAAQLAATIGSTPLTAGHATIISTGNSSAQILFNGAEL